MHGCPYIGVSSSIFLSSTIIVLCSGRLSKAKTKMHKVHSSRPLTVGGSSGEGPARGSGRGEGSVGRACHIIANS